MPPTGTRTNHPHKAKKPRKKNKFNSIINTEDIIDHSNVNINSQILDSHGNTNEDYIYEYGGDIESN